MKIGIDLDNVLVDYMGGFCRFYNNKEGTNFSINDFESYNIWKTIGGGMWRTIRLVKEFYHSDFFDEIELIDGAEEGLRELSREHSPSVITARFKYYKEKTERFFDERLADIDLRCFFTGFINPKRRKLKVCKREGIDLMVEDNVGCALAIAKKGIPVLLFERPWNKNGKSEGLHENITPVKNWDKILGEIR